MDSNKQLINVNPGLAHLLAGQNFNLDVLLKDISVLNTEVAGTYYHHPEKFAQDISPESIITLKREPQNQFDALAIALYFGDLKIGYLPKAKNEVIANLMDAGKQFSAKVKQKTIHSDYNLQLDIEVFMKG
ncbi:hypothetical protein GCM10010992_24160 [Cloacibacterium rupense]|uniref:HIRAN domain-containing protein n=1 Tax=Cloacibacterium rupense TaxID=517423 RepID=A0ABQ2NND1_9FLAO|nr:HIRAN domain-containing protein [Cloacibacterium rupense]GGP05937.1 hypothetical protein GCM10010992_24160 [Cloacibacterium rupense]